MHSAATRPIAICASVTCADLLNLERDLRVMEETGVDYLHIDVMDGVFVPNYCLSPDIMRAIRGASSLPMDVHLMVTQPERYIDTFIDAGADVLVVHAEATVHLQRTLAAIRAAGARAGVALNVATPPSAIEYVLDDLDMVLVMTVNPGYAGQRLVPSTLGKIRNLRTLFARHERAADIQVDGNVSFDTAPRMVRAGANWLVGGTSSLFNSGWTIAEGVRRLRSVAQAAQKEAA